MTRESRVAANRLRGSANETMVREMSAYACAPVDLKVRLMATVEVVTPCEFVE